MSSSVPVGEKLLLTPMEVAHLLSMSYQKFMKLKEEPNFPFTEIIIPGYNNYLYSAEQVKAYINMQIMKEPAEPSFKPQRDPVTGKFIPRARRV